MDLDNYLLKNSKEEETIVFASIVFSIITSVLIFFGIIISKIVTRKIKITKNQIDINDNINSRKNVKFDSYFHTNLNTSIKDKLIILKKQKLLLTYVLRIILRNLFFYRVLMCIILIQIILRQHLKVKKVSPQIIMVKRNL